MRIDKQQVLVIGGSSGIGLGVAGAVLDAGAAVTLVGRSREKLASAARALGEGDRVSTVAADVTREDEVRRVLEARTVDHVVVTAAQIHYQPIRRLDVSSARLAIESKLLAALLVAKHARIAPSGSLTFTAGINTLRPMPGVAAVAAANGGLEALVRALAVELAPIRVNALSPGWIDTPIWDRVPGAPKEERFEQHARRLPVGRMGAPADVGHAAAFLMANRFTTGIVLRVDGGHPLV